MTDFNDWNFSNFFLQLTHLQLLHGLQHMHKCGIIHTDLKTDNVLLYHRPDPSTGIEDDDVSLPLEVRIVDLGSAAFDNGWKQPNIGTNEYRAV